MLFTKRPYGVLGITNILRDQYIGIRRPQSQSSPCEIEIVTPDINIRLQAHLFRESKIMFQNSWVENNRNLPSRVLATLNSINDRDFEVIP